MNQHWGLIRRVITFALGVAVMVDAIQMPNADTAELIIGLILVGVLPIDDLLAVIHRKRGPDDDRTGTYPGQQPADRPAARRGPPDPRR
jgi:hypothetical protein